MLKVVRLMPSSYQGRLRDMDVKHDACMMVTALFQWRPMVRAHFLRFVVFLEPPVTSMALDSFNSKPAAFDPLLANYTTVERSLIKLAIVSIIPASFDRTIGLPDLTLTLFGLG
jgi:hypothetical protein